MYQQRSQNRGFSNQRPNNRRFKRAEKQVDVSLLVKKAADVAPLAEYVSKNSFDDFLIAGALLQNIKAHGYTTPTPIQDQAIPLLLQGKDMIGLANTGTGKTAAFLIPLLNKIYFNKSEQVLIIAPTRELAVQIQQECDAFAKGLNIYSLLCIGGVSMYQQISGLRRRPSVVIGTPGRLKDLKQQGKLNIAAFANIVLDEVDKMLDMGFIHDITFLISHLPKIRQSLFFSATLPPATRTIVASFLQNPVTVSVKSQETPLNVDQDVIKMNGRQKIDVLHDLLSQEAFKKVLIFGRTKWGINKLAEQLEQRRYTVAVLHGNKNQNQRQRALEQFKNDRVKILLVTDIASRGLDINDITHVINYDLPASYEDYVHRIGRTGRANKKGIALSFVN